MGKTEHETRTRATDELYSFIENYVAKSYGMSLIDKWLKANKGKCLLSLMTVCDLAYAITIVKNYGPVWERDHFKETLKEEEQNKYNNYKDLDEPE